MSAKAGATVPKKEGMHFMEASSEWALLFGPAQRPSWDEISAFIDHPLWEPLNRDIKETYETEYELSYSVCRAQPGWNVKYKKGGKALCTLYPEKGKFIALLVIGSKEETGMDALLETLSEYVQRLYANARSMPMGRWLMIHVTDEEILNNVKTIMRLRMKRAI